MHLTLKGPRAQYLTHALVFYKSHQVLGPFYTRDQGLPEWFRISCGWGSKGHDQEESTSHFGSSTKRKVDLGQEVVFCENNNLKISKLYSSYR